jgi:hypothetical protein
MHAIFISLIFLTFSAYASAHIASGVTVTGSSTSQFKSPLARNIDGAMSASSSTPTQGPCQELSAAITQSIASPERKNVVVRRYGANGLRNELQEYDKRATLEAEYLRLRCR